MGRAPIVKAHRWHDQPGPRPADSATPRPATHGPHSTKEGGVIMACATKPSKASKKSGKAKAKKAGKKGKR